MSSRCYVKKCNNLASTTDEAEVLNAFESFNVNDWEDFLKDLADNEKSVAKLLPPPSNTDFVSHVITFIQLCSPLSQRCLGQALNRKLHEAAKTNSAHLKSMLLVFLRILPSVVLVDDLIEITRDNNMPAEIRTSSAFALANHANPVSKNIWYSIDLKISPFLLPPVFAALSNHNPLSAFELLINSEHNPNNKNEIRYPIYIALRTLLERGTAQKQILMMVRKMPNWARKMANEILQFLGDDVLDNKKQISDKESPPITNYTKSMQQNTPSGHSSSKPIRITICDYDPAIRLGLKTVLTPKSNINVVGDVSTHREILNEINSIDTDIILMDLNENDPSEIRHLRQVKKQHPEVKVIIFSNSKDPKLIMESLELGIHGFKSKDSEPNEIIDAIHAVYQGRTSMSTVVTATLLNHMQRNRTRTNKFLSKREREVLDLIAQGMSNSDIANSLHISNRTVKFHVSSILSKLNIKNSAEIAMLVA